MTPSHRTIATTSTVFPIPLDVLEQHLGAFGPVVPYDMEHRPFTPDEARAFLAVAHDATAIYLRPGFITAEIIQGMPRLRIVAVHGVGVEVVDLAAAQAAGVWVTNAPGGNANAVAEHAVGLMLAVARGIARADAALRATGDWERSRVRGFDLRGKTLGLVGFGHIAQRVATIARGFGMAVLAWGRHVEERAPAFSARPAALDDLLAAADVVSIHLPGTAETAGLIGARELALMKPTAILVNTGRGTIVAQDALVAALASGRLAGAGLDVADPEPLPWPHPLYTLPNVVLTPHLGAFTPEAASNIAELCAADIARVYRGERPLHAAADVRRNVAQAVET